MTQIQSVMLGEKADKILNIKISLDPSIKLANDDPNNLSELFDFITGDIDVNMIQNFVKEAELEKWRADGYKLKLRFLPDPDRPHMKRCFLHKDSEIYMLVNQRGGVRLFSSQAAEKWSAKKGISPQKGHYVQE